MKIKQFVLAISIILALSSCKKNSNNPSEILTEKTWKRGLTDKNPSTNPEGRVFYYGVKGCEKDDTYKFGSDGKLVLNRGSEKCEPSETQNETQSYTIDRTKKEIVINGTKFTLAEESNEQIKYCAALPYNTGYDYLIFLLQ